MADYDRKILLVVDDESSVCRALKRLLRGRVDEIVTAQTPADAETVLRSTPVTHVICDHFLGPGQPNGGDVARNWKVDYPKIKVVAILTGTNIGDIEKAPGIDHLLPKTTDPVKLAELMGFSPK